MILNPGKIIAARYEIVDKIGSGGMANVYRAKDHKLDRFVTFKVMKEEFINDDEFLTRFGIEARAAGGLSHQNIVGIYDVGQEDNINYIVMEYINGITLKELINKRAPFTNDEMLGVATQIAAGLSHAHEHGIIHRDIKPQNILVTPSGGIKVTDFGIARAVSADTVTTTGNTMGSVHYFSPEQARGGFVDYKSDIYCLGIVMYEMITGHLPFDGDTPVAIALKQISDPLPDIREQNPSASNAVISIIHKSTEKLSKNRYQNTDELAIDLKRAITASNLEQAKRPYTERGGQAESVSKQQGADGTRASGSGLAEMGVPRFLNTDDATISLDPEEIRQIKAERKGYSDSLGDIAEIDLGSQPRGKQRKLGTKKQKQPEHGLDKRVERKVKVAAVATSAIIIALLTGIGVNLLPAILPDAQEPIEVPNFVGLNQEQAEAWAQDLRIRLQLIGEQFSEEHPEGIIIEQSVGGAGVLYHGGVINVVISRGDERIPVPSLITMDIDAAYDMLSQTEFSVSPPEFLHNEDMAMNIVIDQEPPPGALAHPGASIQLVVSSGPYQQTAVVPNVVGVSEERAISDIQAVRLVVSITSRVANPDVPAGIVISQSIEPDEEISVYTTIGIVVSEGPPEPSPEPSPSPTPSPLPAQQIILTTQGAVPQEVDVVHIRVSRIEPGNATVIFSENIAVSGLPAPFLVPSGGEQFLVEMMDPVTEELFHEYVTSPS